MPWHSEMQHIGPGGARLRPLDAADAAGHIDFKGTAPRLWPWVAGAAAFAVGAAAAVLLEHFAQSPARQPPPSATGDVSLAWPALAVAAILLVFFAVRQATNERRDVPPWERHSK